MPQIGVGQGPGRLHGDGVPGVRAPEGHRRRAVGHGVEQEVELAALVREHPGHHPVAGVPSGGLLGMNLPHGDAQVLHVTEIGEVELEDQFFALAEDSLGLKNDHAGSGFVIIEKFLGIFQYDSMNSHIT